MKDNTPSMNRETAEIIVRTMDELRTYAGLDEAQVRLYRAAVAVIREAGK